LLPRLTLRPSAADSSEPVVTAPSDRRVGPRSG
jgi:hypothetical protein